MAAMGGWQKWGWETGEGVKSGSLSFCLLVGVERLRREVRCWGFRPTEVGMVKKLIRKDPA